MLDSLVSQIQNTSWIEWLGTITGLIAVVLSIREKVLAWPLYIACYGFYIVLSFQASLPAAMVLNSVFIPISIYGWWKWTHPDSESETDENQSLAVSHMNRKLLLTVIIATLLMTLIWGVINAKVIRGHLPYLDAFATVVSFVAQWMLSRKYIENWIAWILADVAFALLWGLQGYWVTVIMFTIFTGLAISGWINWRKGLKTHA